ncbi:hypothetical protein N7471_000921 [Penicillium samsonianum]|uniref:uncharacterized protein n=1 Tax=Penicillium samsonianum TaxID=1882272 RepID=UPI0025486B1C|nr:uncharacterized protein N7471_000921 [Penicillium samsonianum]KAJ6149722.1 hypothetical protein N7471_000921 [Penicillium samsonianum]
MGSSPQWDPRLNGIIENGEVIVQFVEQDDCVKYYKNHSEGIKLNGDDDLTISVTMPEERLQENADLPKRVEEDDRVKHYENRSEDIKLKDGDDELTISVTMPEEGLQDNFDNNGNVRTAQGLSRF